MAHYAKGGYKATIIVPRPAWHDAGPDGHHRQPYSLEMMSRGGSDLVTIGPNARHNWTIRTDVEVSFHWSCLVSYLVALSQVFRY